jgi:Protein of unknown function (DUF664)
VTAGGSFRCVPSPEPVDEKDLLLETLRGQRDHVLGMLDGLSEGDLRRPVLPSGWSCLGLVHHLAVDVERFWFRAVLAGEQVELHSGDGGWRQADGLPAESVLALYREEARRSDAIVEAHGLDDGPAWWPVELFPELPVRDVRRVLLAVITETATHAGHLDAVRELIDGRTWLVLTD